MDLVPFLRLHAVRAAAHRDHVLPRRPRLPALVVQREHAMIARIDVVGVGDRIERHRAGSLRRAEEHRQRPRIQRGDVQRRRDVRGRPVRGDVRAHEGDGDRHLLIVREPALRLERVQQILLRRGQRGRHLLQRQVVGERDVPGDRIEHRRHHGRGRGRLGNVAGLAARGSESDDCSEEVDLVRCHWALNLWVDRPLLSI